MRLKSKDILKPGAVLKVEVIDPNDPFVKGLLKEHRKEMKKLEAMKRSNFRYPRY